MTSDDKPRQYPKAVTPEWVEQHIVEPAHKKIVQELQATSYDYSGLDDYLLKRAIRGYAAEFMRQGRDDVPLLNWNSLEANELSIQAAPGFMHTKAVYAKLLQATDGASIPAWHALEKIILHTILKSCDVREDAFDKSPDFSILKNSEVVIALRKLEQEYAKSNTR